MTLPELRGVTVRDIEKALERDGFALARSSGSHRLYRHPDGRRIVVAFHASGDTFKPGTLRSVLKHAKWGEDDLLRLDLVRRKSTRPEDGRKAA